MVHIRGFVLSYYEGLIGRVRVSFRKGAVSRSFTEYISFVISCLQTSSEAVQRVFVVQDHFDVLAMHSRA